MKQEQVERTTNVYIAKSPSVYAEVDDIDFVETRCDDASAIINNTFKPLNENQFVIAIPFVRNDIPKREGQYLSFSGCVQPIVLEFDHCPIEMQEKRIELLADKLHTPMFQVHSGNKSIHHYIFFKQFAKTKDEYTRRCKKFVAYLAKEYPEYYKELDSSDGRPELVPDYKMFTGNRYARQANGRRDTGVMQEAKMLHSIDDGAVPMDLVELVGDIVPMAGSGTVNSSSETGKPEQKEPRKATYQFIAMGAKEGCRDEECYKAACDLRDCGYSKEGALEKLLEGAKKCKPEFPETEVRAKVESAWEGNGIYDPIDRSKPYAFIERSTGAYWYVINGKLYGAKKDVLKDIFKSYKTSFPEPFDVFEFKFDVNDNNQIDWANRTYNLFSPTQYHLMSPNKATITPIVDFPTINKLLDNLFPRHNEKEHFINWLACALRTRRKLMTAFVLKGSQGAGKGVFFSRVIKPLFGEDQSLQVENEQLKKTFNGYMKHMCFVAFNEVAHDNNTRNSLNSKIKSIVTDPTIMIDDKFIKPFVISNMVNCIFFSNESVPLLVERSDRRFNVVETGGSLNSCSWFDAEVSLPNLSQEVPSFAQYLWNIQIDISKANNAINNDTKSALVNAGSNRFEEFAHYLKAADIEWFLDNATKYYNNPITANDLKSIEKGKIRKNIAAMLFQAVYSDYGVTKNTLTKKLASQGIIAAKDSGPARNPIYKWTT